MSHCWGGRWGDLVGSVASGARGDRVVWLDVFAVRQWPGNGADLDFRGVIQGCVAVVVAAAPVGGKVCEGFMGYQKDRDEYLSSAEYRAVAKVLAFARLWCIGASFRNIPTFYATE
jgi:hypothetical protein